MADYVRELRKRVGNDGKPLIVVGSGALILDEKNRVLLQHRNDCDAWGICGGAVELGETVEETVRREVFEETNLEIGQVSLFNVYSGENQHWIYPDGNEVYIISIVYVTREYHGVMKADGDECRELKFFEINDLPKLASTVVPILRDLKERISEAVSGKR